VDTYSDYSDRLDKAIAEKRIMKFIGKKLPEQVVMGLAPNFLTIEYPLQDRLNLLKTTAPKKGRLDVRFWETSEMPAWRTGLPNEDELKRILDSSNEPIYYICQNSWPVSSTDEILNESDGFYLIVRKHDTSN
jgi:hypothetical protein